MSILPETAAKPANEADFLGGCRCGSPPYRLVSRIIALSAADSWEEARQEWSLAGVFFADNHSPGTCLCGHQPIIEHCVLHNRENGNVAVVGNVCVTRFMGLPTEGIFAGLRRISRDVRKALNPAAIEFAYAVGWIDWWQRRFYLDTIRRRQLSEKQLAKRIEINGRILDCVSSHATAGGDYSDAK